MDNVTLLIPLFFSLVLIFALYRLFKRFRTNERTKSEFITIIAHKFRTPLSQAKWIIENMISVEKDSSRRESLGEIAKINEHLVSMAGTMMELADSDKSTRKAYTWERVDMCTFVREIGETFKPRFHEKNIFFALSCDEGEAWAKIDRARMTFAVQALLENACIYSPVAAKVEVSVTHTGGLRRKVVISVKDTGIGIDRSDKRKIFRQFYRTENAQAMDTEGFGIGLHLARSIVGRHKGKIRFYSAGVGQGSLFQIILSRVK